MYVKDWAVDSLQEIQLSLKPNHNKSHQLLIGPKGPDLDPNCLQRLLTVGREETENQKANDL